MRPPLITENTLLPCLEKNEVDIAPTGGNVTKFTDTKRALIAYNNSVFIVSLC